MEVNVQLHAPAAFRSRKESSAWVCRTAGLDAVTKRKIPASAKKWTPVVHFVKRHFADWAILGHCVLK